MGCSRHLLFYAAGLCFGVVMYQHTSVMEQPCACPRSCSSDLSLNSSSSSSGRAAITQYTSAVVFGFLCHLLYPQQLGLINSDGSSGSDTSNLPHSPMAGMTGYSPFMGAPWGNTLYSGGGNGAASDAPVPPALELPNSPMSPGRPCM